jgi:hypothetical protein
MLHERDSPGHECDPGTPDGSAGVCNNAVSCTSRSLSPKLSAKPVAPLPRTLSDLFATMSNTTDSVTPNMFLSQLRQAEPQFAERARNSMVFSQQGLLPRAYPIDYVTNTSRRCGRVLVEDLPGHPGSPGHPWPRRCTKCSRQVRGIVLVCDLGPRVRSNKLPSIC